MRKFAFIKFIMLVFLGVHSSSEACTGLKLSANNGNAVHGRTFEFGINVDTSLVFVPQGYAFTSTTPMGKGLTYQGKYAVVGTICANDLLVMDGMNEKGLSVGTFYFPGYASYTPTTSENQNRSLAPVDFPNWIVTQFASLDEVKDNLKNVVIAPTVTPVWGNTPPPFHYIVYDKEGNSIVIEPMDGKLMVHDNPLGVLTNSPTFDWHMTNLRNYIDLNPKNVQPVNVEGIVLAPFGQGSGMVGLPGDFTPPSRFVRAAVFATTAVKPANAQEAVFQAFHILNQFDIPKGVSRAIAKGKTYDDYTLATVVHDPINLMYYIRTFDDQNIRSISLNSFDKDTREIRKMSSSGRQTFVDVSNKLKPMAKG